jgi:iron complex outermembrane receptor protein
MARVFLLMVLLWQFVYVEGLAQSQTIYGIVKDRGNDAPLGYCLIYLINSTLQVYSDDNGNFSLGVPASRSSGQIVFSYPDYVSDTVQLVTGKQHYTVLLKPVQTQLDEIVITGVSKATLVRENPVPVISISARSIDRTIESNIIDALVKNAPGLNAVKTGPNISKPFIRGLGYNRVLTLYDGIRQEGQQWGDEHGIEIDAYNMERAEVIKGPSGIMYGSDAMAGVLSFFPSMPQKKDSVLTGKWISEYQSNNGLIGSGLRLGLYKKRFLFSLRGSVRMAKNYGNPVDERVYNTGFREKNLSALLGYASTQGRIHLNATLYDNLQGIPDGSRDSLYHQFTKQVQESSADHPAARPVVSKGELNSYRLSPLHQHIQHRRIYVNTHYALGNGAMDAQLAFQQSVRREYNHPTVPSQAGLFVRLNTLNYGLRYNLPRFCNMDASVGVNGMYQDNKNREGTDFPIPDFNLTDLGSYAFLKYKYGLWTISGGLRVDLRQLSGDNFYVGPRGGKGFEAHVAPPDTAGSKLQYPALKQTFQGFSASIGSTFLMTGNISLKANISRGYRAPNIAEIASNGLDPGAKIVYIGNRNFVPEFNIQEDIGVEGKFKDFSWSLSVFNNYLHHYIYLAQLVDDNGVPVVLVPGNKTFNYQQASAQLYGFEGGLSVHPLAMKGFLFSNSFATVYGYNKKYSNEGVNGEYLPFIPPFKLISSLSQDIAFKHAFVKSISLKAELEYNAAQRRFLALYSTETYTPGYSLFNVAGNMELNYAKKSFLTLQFQVNNVFDTSYQSNLSRLKYFGIYGMGRNVCFRMVVPF